MNRSESWAEPSHPNEKNTNWLVKRVEKIKLLRLSYDAECTKLGYETCLRNILQKGRKKTINRFTPELNMMMLNLGLAFFLFGTMLAFHREFIRFQHPRIDYLLLFFFKCLQVYLVFVLNITIILPIIREFFACWL